ncbi:cobalamin biosynthesis protein [Lichenicoccus roseus]|uniref:cobalamin biosynthesis protein n=1 Tax=Lichenicoccus roseus TaxID=2683649 RepID=UPI001F0EEF2D|nr:cobalamin biosynthesis protein [Lichenicoccus roseus]
MADLVAAGLGCRRGVPAAAVLALLRACAAEAGSTPGLLAVPDFKRDEPGLDEAARRLGLTLLRVPNDQLRAQQPRCVTRSARVEDAVGLPSVAEACALAALGPQARLLLPRRAADGVTCAFALLEATP